MTDGTRTAAPGGAPRRRITMEQTFKATVKDVWDLRTQRAVMGWESELGKFTKAIAAGVRP